MGRQPSLQKRKVSNIKEDFFYLEPLEYIPKEYWEEEVWLLVPAKKSYLYETKRRLRDFLNERYILYQLKKLGLDKYDSVIEMTQREAWYYIEIVIDRAKKVLEAEKADKERIKKMKMDGTYNDFTSGMIKFCKDIRETAGEPYWGYVYDILRIKAKARATVYEITKDKDEKDVYKAIGLDKDTLINYTDAPLYLILCEKEDIVTAFLKELLKRGYNKEYFYCINMGGEATSNVVRLLRKYNEIKNFHCFILHDMDISGLRVFFNMKKHFNCKSIGVNPEFLEHCEHKFDDFSEEYRTDSEKGKVRERCSDEMEQGAHTTLGELDISIEEFEKYKSWINRCVKKRVELNSITTFRLEEDHTKSKVIDFINYFIHILEETPWNINRIRPLKKEEKVLDYWKEWDGKSYLWTIKTRIPRVGVYPDLILEFDKEDAIEVKISEECEDYLSRINEIDDLITTNTESVKERLEGLKDAEDEAKNDMVDEIKKEHPKIFDWISWRDILQSIYPGKVEKMNRLIKTAQKRVQISNKTEWVKLKRKLRSYVGSIKDNMPEKAIRAKEQELREYTKTNTARISAIEMKDRFNKHLQFNLRLTTEYKEVEADITKLKEELEDRKAKEDKRIELLDKFKEKIEEMFTELMEDLEGFDSKISE